jgi:transcriptional regulator GlxA family with amidase domain
MQRRIAIVVLPETDLLDIAGPYEVFARAAQLVQEQRKLRYAPYSVDVLTADGSPVKTWLGLTVAATQACRTYEEPPDTLIVAARPEIAASDKNPEVVFWVRRQAQETRRVCSVCTGVFLLAQAGLLDGKRVTTHWQFAGELAERYPRIKVDPEPVYVRDGNVYTSAGCTAALDLALALVEEDWGHTIVAEIAREMVLFLRRPSSQAQLSAVLSLQTAARQPMRELQDWILENLRLPLTVEDLAERAHMSPRNFARAFTKEVGTTPAKFLEAVRIEAARRRLQETSLGVDEIAAECGFGTDETMRRVFLRQVGVPPSAYRRQLRLA